MVERLRCHLLLAVFGPLHLLQAVRLLRWLLVQNLLQLHLSSCAALGPVSSIASSVSVSVAGQIHTRIMFASSTGSCPEESEKCGDFSTEQFKGFRKRWAARPSGSPSDIFGDGLQSENCLLNMLKLELQPSASNLMMLMVWFPWWTAQWMSLLSNRSYLPQVRAGATGWKGMHC